MRERVIKDCTSKGARRFSASALITAALLLFSLLHVSVALAELKLESVYPTLGEVGKPLTGSLRGTGFDENTRVSMYIDVRNEWKIVGSVNETNSAQAIAASGLIVYLAVEEGLQVINISNPSNPVIIFREDTNIYDATTVEVAGDYLYLSDYEGFKVIDIKNPSAPSVKWSTASSGYAKDIAVSGDYAYVAEGGDVGAVQIYKVDKTDGLTSLGTLSDITGAEGITVSDNYAYVADGVNGLKIFNISNPEIPQYLGMQDTDGDAYDVTVSGSYAYISDGSKGLQVIDVSNPESPLSKGSIETPGSALSATISGNYVYVACGKEGQQVIDVSDPDNPEITGFVDTPGSAQDILISGDYAFIADDDSGLQVIDIINRALQREEVIADMKPGGRAEGVMISGTNAYTAAGAIGVRIVDISNSLTPDVINTINTPGYAEEVVIDGNFIFVADGNQGLQVIDLSAHESPVIIEAASRDTSGYAKDIVISAGYAFIAADDGGLLSIDISNPLVPGSPVSTISDTGFSADSVAVSGNYAYVTDDSDDSKGLHVINISDPAAPQMETTINTGGLPRDAAVYGNYVFIADDYGGITVLNVSDPANRTVAAVLNDPESGDVYSVTISGDLAYVADDRNGIRVLDISIPAVPQVIGHIDTRGYTGGVADLGDFAYIADNFSGLVIVPKPVEISPITLNSETSISLTLPGPSMKGHYTLRVFNQTESSELPGAVTFETADFVKEIALSRAIIVAGYGPDDNSIWDETQMLANLAYRTLLYQGYTRENIYYLSSVNEDVDGNGVLDDIDGDASVDSLSDALNTWVMGDLANTRNLFVYMADHGGDGVFKMKKDEDLVVETLDGLFDNLQNKMDGKLIFVYEACNSGSFIHSGDNVPVMVPPAGKEQKRIIITSSAWDERSIFQESGKLTFSYNFLDSISNGRFVSDAFNLGSTTVLGIPQTPGLDSNGDGVENTPDDNIDALVIGRGYRPASEMPVISCVSPVQDLGEGSTATIWANGVFDADGIEEVWAVITPSDNEDGSPYAPITDLDKLVLLPKPSGRYEADYTNFNEKGIYKISIYAMDEKGTISLPESTTVNKTTVPPLEEDQYEDDDTDVTASLIVINERDPQRHNFLSDNEDWVVFVAEPGERYTVKASNLGTNADIELELYDSIGDDEPIQTENSGGVQEKEEMYINWDWNNCPDCGDGIFYMRVHNKGQHGQDTKYDLEIYPSYAFDLFSRCIKGSITDSSNSQIINCETVSASGTPGVCVANGNYVVMSLVSAPYNVAVTKAGYEPASEGVVVTDGCVERDIVMTQECIPSQELCFDGIDNDCDGDIDPDDINCVEVITPPGLNVLVRPIDPASGEAPVTLIFDEVTVGGIITVTISATGASPPTGLMLGAPPTYYDITTTAGYNPDVHICIDYSAIAFNDNGSAGLYHYENSQWDDVTDIGYPDTVNKIICGTVSSLSPFAIFEPCPNDRDCDSYTDDEEIAGGSDPDNPDSKPEASELQLYKGYNLVSFPAETMYYLNVSDFMNDLGGSSVISRVLSFDPVTRIFNEVVYNSGQSYGQLPERQGFAGLIIYAKQEMPLDFSSTYCQTWDLKTGINLVGSGCIADGMTAYKLLNDIGSDKVISIQHFNPLIGKFESANYENNQLVGVNFTIKSGEGYFIFIK